MEKTKKKVDWKKVLQVAGVVAAGGVVGSVCCAAGFNLAVRQFKGTSVLECESINTVLKDAQISLPLKDVFAGVCRSGLTIGDLGKLGERILADMDSCPGFTDTFTHFIVIGKSRET